MNPRKLFRDRADAGQKLAAHLDAYRRASPIVLGLPCGGVPVAYEVAHALGAPLDVCVVRKLGAPTRPELGLGAVGEDGALYVDREAMDRLDVAEEELRDILTTKQAAVERQVKRFRDGTRPIDVRGRTVLVVDDGVATGGTARAALQTLRARGASAIVLAVPVGASETLDELAALADEIVCPHPEETLYAISPWYEDFSATTEADVIELLARSRAELARARLERGLGRRASPAPPDRGALVRDVRIPIDGARLEGRLTIPPNPRGLVIFAHGSGSSRHSPRNQYVASVLHEAGLATLLFDLLTEAEDAIDARTAHLRFDIPLLASRLVAATDWARQDRDTRSLDLGYLGASTGAAAALVAAAERPDVVHAVVSRGGRPDLAEASLGDVQAPTLLLVGGLDGEVLTLNRETLYFLGCEKLLEVVPEATHLFEEPGTLDQAAASAAKWLTNHLHSSASTLASRA